MSKALKVVMVVRGTEGFGIRTHLLYAQAYGPKFGIDYEWVCMEPGTFYEDLRERGARVTLLNIELPFKYPKSPLLLPLIWLGSWRRWWEGYRAIRAYLLGARPDIAFSLAHQLHVLSGLAAKRAGCVSVGRFPSPLNRKRLLGLQRVLASIVFAWSLDAVIAVSEYARSTLWGPARRKARRIFNGFEIERIRRQTDGVEKIPGRIILVGRLVDWKKQDLAVRALRLLAEEGTDCTLELLGGPADESNKYYVYLQRLVRSLELEDRVRFAGVVSPPYRRVAAASVCVSCATTEAGGNAVIEAMACGTALVVANRSAPAESVRDGVTGLHFEADDPTSLARALREVLCDPDLRLRLADAAYQRARTDFDIRVHMKAVRAFFDECRSRKASRCSP